ncbi:MAG: aspartate aminotransferase family protein [Nitrospinota bacterium]|nr:MAG: aspartate aminotransferase family protein [Nitrospinota bacterium]
MSIPPDHLRHIVVDFQQMQEFMKDPLIIARAEGITYEDIHGKRYLDGLSGVFVVNVGHQNRRVIEAMKAQLERLTFAPPLHSTNPQAIELGRMIAELAPGDLNTVKLVSGGSEATETAMKLARQYHKQSGAPGRYKIISLYGSYHGATMGALAATGTTRRRSMFEPFGPGYVRIPPPYCYRCPYGLTYPGCHLTCAHVLDTVIEGEDPNTVAAVLIEPVINTAGGLVPPPEYLPIIREICDRHGVLLIFDEIITGFGRTGKLFAAHTFQVTPDLLCLGKGMSSGYAPLAGVVYSDRVAQAFWGRGEDRVEFSHGHTYGANPLSCAAGIANIQEILERHLPERAARVGQHLRQQLDALRRYGVIGDIRGIGLYGAVEFVKNPTTRERFPPEVALGILVGKACLKNGLILRADAHTVTLAPPLITTEAQSEEMVHILAQSLEQVLQEIKPPVPGQDSP